MSVNKRDILEKYVRLDSNGKSICEVDCRKEFLVPSVLAGGCANYLDDVEDELYCEDPLTCYNCRYRRWERGGFSCYKGFPVE